MLALNWRSVVTEPRIAAKGVRRSCDTDDKSVERESLLLRNCLRCLIRFRKPQPLCRKRGLFKQRRQHFSPHPERQARLPPRRSQGDQAVRQADLVNEAEFEPCRPSIPAMPPSPDGPSRKTNSAF